MAFPFVVRYLYARVAEHPTPFEAGRVRARGPRRAGDPVRGFAVGGARPARFGDVCVYDFVGGVWGNRPYCSPEYPTLPVAIYRLLGRPGVLNDGQGFALSTILMLVTAGGMVLIERMRVGEGEEF